MVMAPGWPASFCKSIPMRTPTFNQQHFYQLYIHLQKDGKVGRCTAQNGSFRFEVWYGDDPNDHPVMAGSGWSAYETWAVVDGKPVLIKSEPGCVWMS